MDFIVHNFANVMSVHKFAHVFISMCSQTYESTQVNSLVVVHGGGEEGQIFNKEEQLTE